MNIQHYNNADLDVVECHGAVECTNTTKLGNMTSSECCVRNPEGLAYSKPGSEKCYECTGKSAWFSRSCEFKICIILCSFWLA